MPMRDNGEEMPMRGNGKNGSEKPVEKPDDHYLGRVIMLTSMITNHVGSCVFLI